MHSPIKKTKKKKRAKTLDNSDIRTSADRGGELNLARRQRSSSAPPKPRGQTIDNLSSRIDRPALLRRLVDVEDSSSLAFMLNALQTVNAPKFSENRRKELTTLAKGSGQTHLAEQMGLRTAKSQKPQPGFAPQHIKSTLYLRTGLDQLISLLPKLGAQPGDYPVNSPMVLARLRLLLPPEDLAKLSTVPSAKGNLHFLRVAGSLSSGADLNKLLHDVGAMPSPYQLYKLLDDGKQRVQADFNADTPVKLETLLQSNAFARVESLATTSKAQKAMYGVIVHLLKGLDPDRLRTFDPLTNNALTSLDRLVRVAAASDLDPDTLANAIDLMMDELLVVLGSRPHYNYSDFEKAVRKIDNARSPSLATLLQNPDIQCRYYYASSGMDALSTALTIALSNLDEGSIRRATEDLDYFELTHLLENLKRGKVVKLGNTNVVIAALHPSTPYKQQNIAELHANISSTLSEHTGDKPLSLVLDTTIETGGDELNQLWEKLSADIAAGKLIVFTAKSYHKYATLGTGKLSAGAMTLVGKQGRGFPGMQVQVRQHDGALDFADSPEAQLMTHILTYAAEDEITLIKGAAANAKFVDTLCWPVGDHRDSKFAEGIPLLFRAMGGQDVRPFVELLNIDKRDSFSFLRTSFVPIDLHDGCVRINPGQESSEAMVEFFYALGHLALGAKPGIEKRDVPNFTLATIFTQLEALKGLKKEAAETTYTSNIRASYFFLAAQLLLVKSGPITENAKLIIQSAGALDVTERRNFLTSFGGFIGAEMLGVTRPMQAQLAARYLDLCCLDWPMGDVNSLESAKKAARLVTPEDAALIAKKLPSGMQLQQRQEFGRLLNAKPPSPAQLKSKLTGGN